MTSIIIDALCEIPYAYSIDGRIMYFQEMIERDLNICGTDIKKDRDEYYISTSSSYIGDKIFVSIGSRCSSRHFLSCRILRNNIYDSRGDIIYSDFDISIYESMLNNCKSNYYGYYPIDYVNKVRRNFKISKL